ncbi:Linear gramicidin synthase subunit D [Rubripirellula tenax]|uniref:Linear gramicidin synthase subunit D n=1 Tax=Rubripirellula tenax TaxID=2528015 RepID=A0A5C6FIS5_9BACT|nr:amino acid adenylation domain-containing protein [Rubripirellula tenax]TWU60840.1 Linear gramicidin synthase subunit D [Rubripirellula tenax]
MTTTEHEALVAFPTLWSRQLAQTPDRTAVIAEDGTLSYAELDAMAVAIAARLKASGITAGDCVGMCVDRSPEAIAAMIGIMKLGAVFVPLDPEYPVDRLAYMVGDAAIRTILGHPHYQASIGKNLVGGEAAPCEWIDCEPSLWLDANIESVSFPSIAPDDLAYIMYTSGSTGKPKGVEIQHAALATYCYADIDCYKINQDDRTLQFSTLNFDIAIEEIFPPLLTGGAVVVRPRGRANERNELSTLVNRFGVTAIHLATAYWHQWVDLMVATGERIPPSIGLMIVTGEKVSVAHYRRWQQLCDRDVLWCNAYGPTEATVSATVFIPDDQFDAANMPIGKPMKRYEAFVLDDQRRVLDVGETGQLFLGGPALAKGYHNRPDLTDAAFIRTEINGEMRRLYRTGDVARFLPDGNIDFGGRLDHQIKLGSYRIEPAEIEAVVNECESVLESLVSYDGVDGKKFLIAYLAVGPAQVSANEVASFLRQKLPAYMVPARYVFLDSFPKTINGKIDRRRLPPPAESVVPRDDSYVAPQTPMQRYLVELWQDVLHLPEIGIHDDFFLLGGSSLLVTQIVARLTTEKNIELPVRDFFANPTVASAARHLEQTDGQVTNGDDDDILVHRHHLPMIDADYFTSDGDRLYAVRYSPRNRSSQRAIVLCHSIGHEYARGYRNLQQLAIQLCKAGHEVLRFDYASTGNSEGDCAKLTIDRMRQNLADAKTFLATRSGVECISAVGLRFGATIAATMPRETFDSVVMWDPVLCGEQFLSTTDGFHHAALTSLTRFNQVRSRGAIDQSFGQVMTTRKRNSLGAIHLDPTRTLGDSFTIVLTDRWDESPSAATWKSNQTHVIETRDVAAWNDSRYTESAFSSPESFQAITKHFSDAESRQ